MTTGAAEKEGMLTRLERRIGKLLEPPAASEELDPHWLDLTKLTGEERTLVEDQARRLNARRYPWVALFILLAVLIWWPLDPFAYAGDSQLLLQHALWRLHALVVLPAFLLIARWLPAYRRYPSVFGALLVFELITFFGWHLSALGGLDKPYFHFLYVTSVVSVIAIMPLRWRICVVLLVLAGAVVGYFGRSPTHLEHPLLTTVGGHLAFVACFAVVLGHMVTLLTLRSLVQQLRLGRQQQRLETLNDTLSEQVEAQTRDLRLLARKLDTAAQEERSYLARELHDELGQELTALRLALTLAKHHLEGEQGKLARALDEIGLLLGRTRETMRRILSRLRPVPLEKLGLDAAVRWAVEDLGLRTELQTSFETSPGELDLGSLGLGEGQSLALYRILQEALTNVARHARASAVKVRVEDLAGKVRLAVADDGVGLPEVQGAGVGGVGMIGIRERVREHGGAVRWESSAGSGVTMIADLPLEQTSGVSDTMH